ncbi:hypothetical protein B566_EDAN012748 [Ephemera danica]|nr:hypothetical protein B566_EDAN012748 [Ephemera danica]
MTWKPLSRSTSIASLSSSFNNSFQDPSSPPPGGGMGGMESLPERRASDEIDPWWDSTRSRMQDKECQTESAEAQTIAERVEQLDLGLDDELSSLITQHETEVRALHNKLLVSENENKKLQTESQTIKMNRDRMMEDLQQQIAEYNGIQEKLTYYEQECEKVRMEASGAQQPQGGNTSEETAALLARIVELEAQLTDRQMLDDERRDLEKEATAAKELRVQLQEARDACEDLETQIKLEESHTKKTKWEMTSLQSHVDTLLKENDQLRNDLTQISQTLTEAREKTTTNDLYVEKLTEQVKALKDVVSIGKQMLGMRDGEVEHLQRKVQNLEDMLETEREKNTVLSTSFSPSPDLKKEYEAQLANFKSLKEIYTQRTELVSLENQALKDTLQDKDRQLELMERRHNDLQNQYTTMKDSLGEKETSVNELQRRIGTLTEDCRCLTNQLTMINNLFTELGKSDVDMEKLRALQDAMADGLTDSENTATNLSRVWCALSELLENSSGDTPQPVEGSEGCYKSVNTPYGPRVVISVSQTFMRLKDLILEKKSLQKELGQLRNLNSHLETKLVQQENRLSLVLQELKKTWGVVNKMRSQHSQLRNSEAILRYDLQQKRKIVTELKEELEWCKETWQQARNKTTESELQYRSLKDEFASRRRRPLLADDSTEMNSAESGYSDGRGEDDSGGSSTSDGEENTGDMTGSEPSSASKSPDILPPDSRPGSGGYTDSTLSNETALEITQSPHTIESASPPQIPPSPPISPSTGAIKKIFSAAPSPTSEPEISIPPVLETTNQPEIASVPVPVPETTTSNQPENSTTPKPVAEILDARAARLKRLEEQCSQLFKRVVRTSNMSVAISNRLEELHEQYGDTEDNSARRRQRMSEVAQATNISPSPPESPTNPRLVTNQNKSEDTPVNIPKPPPMPTVLPSTRLPTELPDKTFFDVPDPDTVQQNEKLDFRIVSAQDLPRRTERLKRRSAVDESEIQSHESMQRSHKSEATEAQESLNAALEAERKRAELIDRELTSLRVDLADQSQQLGQLEEQLTKEIARKEEAESGLEQKRAECEALRLELQELVVRERELKQRLEDSDAESGSRLLELQQLQGDTKHLHNAIIKLTKQKDALFKECYALKQANREATWQADNQVIVCSACAVPFSLLSLGVSSWRFQSSHQVLLRMPCKTSYDRQHH